MNPLNMTKGVPRGTPFVFLEIISGMNYLPKYTSKTDISDGETPEIRDA